MIKVKLYRPDHHPFNIHVYVYQEWNGTQNDYYSYGKDGIMVSERIDVFASEPPVFAKIPMDIAQAFAVEFIKFSEQNKIEIKTQSNLEGKLESTEKHLHDMQSIAFKLIDHLAEKP